MKNTNSLREHLYNWRASAPPPPMICSLDSLIKTLNITGIRIIEIQSLPKGAIATLSLICADYTPPSVTVRGRSIRTLKKLLHNYKASLHGQVAPVQASNDSGIYFAGSCKGHFPPTGEKVGP